LKLKICKISATKKKRKVVSNVQYWYKYYILIPIYQTFCPTLLPYIYSLIYPHDKYKENDKLKTPTLNPKILWVYPYRDWQFSIAIKKVNIVSVITHWWAGHNSHGSCCPSPNSQGTLPQLPWDLFFSWFFFIDFFTVYLRLVIKTNIAWELTKSIRSQLHWQNTFQNSRRCLCFFHPYTVFFIKLNLFILIIILYINLLFRFLFPST